MAVEKETQFEAWLEENMPEPGGGNPNYVETITGTLANPWGDISVSDFSNGLLAGELSATMEIFVGGSSAKVNPVTTNSYLIFSVAAYSSGGWDTIASAAFRKNNGQLIYAYYERTGSLVDLAAMADSVSTTLIIIHHPLPEN